MARTPKFFQYLLIGLGGFLCFWSCDEKVTIPAGALEEQQVDISGVWKVGQVLLNDIDVTGRFDFSQIKLTLNMSNNPFDYQIESGSAPFPVREHGSWSFNDNIYPTSMTFLTGSMQRSIDFEEPPISGNNSLKMAFTLGCHDNIYIYAFEKVQQ